MENVWEKFIFQLSQKQSNINARCNISNVISHMAHLMEQLVFHPRAYFYFANFNFRFWDLLVRKLKLQNFY